MNLFKRYHYMVAPIWVSRDLSTNRPDDADNCAWAHELSMVEPFKDHHLRRHYRRLDLHWLGAIIRRGRSAKHYLIKCLCDNIIDQAREFYSDEQIEWAARTDLPDHFQIPPRPERVPDPEFKEIPPTPHHRERPSS